MNGAEHPRLISLRDAARWLSVSPQTLRRWIRSGHLPATRTIGGHVRVEAREIEALIDRAHVDCQALSGKGHRPVR